MARTNTALWWFACLAVCAFYLFTVPRLWQCEGVDEIEYLNLAHSLARGEGYTIGGHVHVLYPPLLPVLLSLGMHEGIPAWSGLYRLNALVGLMAVVLGASWLRRFGRAGVFAAWLSLFSYYAWSFSTRYLLSDQLSALLSIGSLMLVWRILERNRVNAWECALVSAGALLCAMTRFGSVSLFAAVALAGFLRWFQSKVRVGLLVGGLVLLVGGGYTVYWEIRGAVIDPSAVESYGRWALRLMGLSHEATGIIAQNAGEGAGGGMNWPARVLATGVQCGQYAASLVRMPVNFSPLALLLGVLVLLGVVSHLKRFPWSPMGWYVLISLGVISLTSWVSSYPRYLYALTPFLFFFLTLGVDRWRRNLLERADPFCSLATALWGVVGLYWSYVKPLHFSAATGEELYVLFTGLVCILIYIVLAIFGVRGLFRRALVADAFAPAVAVAILFICGAHSFFLASERFQKTLNNTTLKNRNLENVVLLGQWLDQSTAPDSVVVSSAPGLMTFLADRRSLPPVYDGAGCLVANLNMYGVAVGRLRDVPQFRAADEQRLAVAFNKWDVVHVVGETVVYQPPNRASSVR